MSAHIERRVVLGRSRSAYRWWRWRARRARQALRRARSAGSRSRPRNSLPDGITTGPDGNLWFTEFAASKIGRITPTGTITEFPIPTAEQRPVRDHGGPRRQPLVHRECRRQDRADHPDRQRSPSSRSPPPAASRTGSRRAPTATSGSPSERQQDRADQPATDAITEFPIPTAGSGPHGITAGPDGNLWFTERERRQDRADHPDAARHHRVPGPRRPAASRTGSRRAPTATSGSPRRRQQDRADHPDGHAITEFPIPTASSGPDRDHGGPRRQPLVHRVRRPTRSGGSPRRPRHHRVPDPHAPAPPARDHGGPRRQPLVHRGVRQQDRAGPTPAAPGGDQCVVPKLKGKTLTQARQLLRRAHCKLGKVTKPARHRAQARRGESEACRQEGSAQRGQGQPAARLRTPARRNGRWCLRLQRPHRIAFRREGDGPVGWRLGLKLGREAEDVGRSRSDESRDHVRTADSWGAHVLGRADPRVEPAHCRRRTAREASRTRGAGSARPSWPSLLAAALLSLALGAALYEASGRRALLGGSRRALPRLLAPAPRSLSAEEGALQSSARGAGTDLPGAGRRKPGLPGPRLERRLRGGEPRAASQARFDRSGVALSSGATRVGIEPARRGLRQLAERRWPGRPARAGQPRPL